MVTYLSLDYYWPPARLLDENILDGRCCHAQVVDKDGVPLTNEELSRKRRDCDLCGSALWRVKAERGWYYLC